MSQCRSASESIFGSLFSIWVGEDRVWLIYGMTGQRTPVILDHCGVVAALLPNLGHVGKLRLGISEVSGIWSNAVE